MIWYEKLWPALLTPSHAFITSILVNVFPNILAGNASNDIRGNPVFLYFWFNFNCFTNSFYK